MRPKLLSVLAISAVALVGCSTGETATTPVASPSESAVSVDPRPTTVEEINLDTDEATKAEFLFVRLAQARLSSSGLPEIDGEKLTDALYNFCESGESMNLTDEDSTDKYIDNLAINGTCEKLDQ